MPPPNADESIVDGADTERSRSEPPPEAKEVDDVAEAESDADNAGGRSDDDEDNDDDDDAAIGGAVAADDDRDGASKLAKSSPLRFNAPRPRSATPTPPLAC